MFPGIVITLFPDMIEVYQVYPTGYQKSVMAGDEDVQLVKWAAEGMRSSAFGEVILSDLELGICSFQNQLREKIPVVGKGQPPETETLEQVNQMLLSQCKLTHVA